MFQFLLKIGAMAVALAMFKYRERLGDMLGDQYWMRYVGGVYNFVMIIAALLFFWAIASITGTEKIFFFPLYFLLGGAFT